MAETKSKYFELPLSRKIELLSIELNRRAELSDEEQALLDYTRDIAEAPTTAIIHMLAHELSMARVDEKPVAQEPVPTKRARK